VKTGREINIELDIGAHGSIGIEAPTKEECLELFRGHKDKT
jgi:hypothetical protein